MFEEFNHSKKLQSIDKNQDYLYYTYAKCNVKLDSLSTTSKAQLKSIFEENGKSGVNDENELPELIMKNGNQTLGHFCRRHAGWRPLTRQECLKIVYKVFQAVRLLQENNLVHQDIKSDNIVAFGSRGDPETRLIDFGSMRSADKVYLGVYQIHMKIINRFKTLDKKTQSALYRLAISGKRLKTAQIAEKIDKILSPKTPETPETPEASGANASMRSKHSDSSPSLSPERENTGDNFKANCLKYIRGLLKRNDPNFLLEREYYVNPPEYRLFWPLTSEISEYRLTRWENIVDPKSQASWLQREASICRHFIRAYRQYKIGNEVGSEGDSTPPQAEDFKQFLSLLEVDMHVPYNSEESLKRRLHIFNAELALKSDVFSLGLVLLDLDTYLVGERDDNQRVVPSFKRLVRGLLNPNPIVRLSIGQAIDSIDSILKIK